MPEDTNHKLWLIYSQLKDAEDDAERRLELLVRSREELGQVINELNRQTMPDLYTALAEAGAKGGSVKSEAKTAASRANGAKGGRPRNTYFCLDCAPPNTDADNERLIDSSGSTNIQGKKCTDCGRQAYYRLE